MLPRASFSPILPLLLLILLSSLTVAEQRILDRLLRRLLVDLEHSSR